MNKKVIPNAGPVSLAYLKFRMRSVPEYIISYYFSTQRRLRPIKIQTNCNIFKRIIDNIIVTPIGILLWHSRIKNRHILIQSSFS